MEKQDALPALAALGQETRIDVFRLLVRAGNIGVPAGEIARALDARANTISNHLTVLAHAGLVMSRREGRSIRYFACFETMNGLMAYLLQDCCGGAARECGRDE